MKRSLILLTAVLAMTLGVITNSEEQTERQFRVQVSVSSKDDSFEGLVTSYINRELRSLRDVEIVYRDPEWKLSIVALEISTKSGYKTGVGLSTVVLRRFDNQSLVSLLPENSRGFVRLGTSNLYDDFDHWINIDSDDNLREICNKIVANFDADHLEKKRKLRQYTR